jgi:uroporphyrinogen-III decarboxylase
VTEFGHRFFTHPDSGGSGSEDIRYTGRRTDVDDYRRFHCPIRSIIEPIQNEGTPSTLCEGCLAVLNEARDGARDYVDWRTNLRNVSERFGEDTVLPGNLDPTA